MRPNIILHVDNSELGRKLHAAIFGDKEVAERASNVIDKTDPIALRAFMDSLPIEDLFLYRMRCQNSISLAYSLLLVLEATIVTKVVMEEESH